MLWPLRTGWTLAIPTGIWRKGNGSRQLRLMEKRRQKLCLPSLIMANVRSLANKAGELTALSQRENLELSLMCFTETWLHQDLPEDKVSIREFSHSYQGCLCDLILFISSLIYFYLSLLCLQGATVKKQFPPGGEWRRLIDWLISHKMTLNSNAFVRKLRPYYSLTASLHVLLVRI